MTISAAKIVDEFIEHEKIPSDQEISRILSELGRTSSRTEYDRLDFKQEFSQSPDSWLDLVKHIVAMANIGGGALIFGMSDGGARVGLTESLLSVFDPTVVATKVRKYSASAQVRVSYSEICSYRKIFGALWVHPTSRIIIFDKTIHYGNSKVALQQGVVYVRKQSSTAPASQHEMNEAMDRVVTRNLRAFMARIDHVASLPTSAQLIATNPDTDRGYILTARGEGIPVTIVGPEDSANAVKIDETLLPDVPLAGPTHELANQVRHWRMDPGHRVKPGTLHRWYLQRDNLDLSMVEEGVEFALASAVDGSDFPMFWASQMERPKLRRLIQRKMDAHDYPANQIIPYLVGAFFWNERADLLKPGYASEGVLKRILKWPNLATYVRDIRRAGALIRYQDKTIRVSEALEDRAIAQDTFSTILARPEKDIQSNRMALHQMDLFLHVPVNIDETGRFSTM